MNDVVVSDVQQIDRVGVLAPYVAQIHALLCKWEGKESRFKISIKQYEIDVHGWDKAQLRDEFESEVPVPGTWAYQVCEGLAVQARALSDVTRFEAAATTPELDAAALRRELVFDGALARLVRHDLERTIAELNDSGRTGPAKYLAEFAARVNAGLAPLETALGPDGALSAESLAHGWLQSSGDGATLRDNGNRRSTKATPSTNGSPVTASVPAGFSATGEPTLARKKSYSLRHVIYASVAIVIAIVVPYIAYSSLTAEPLTVARCLKYVKGIEGFSGTPPKLRVTVVGDYWRELPSSERTALMHGATVGLPRLDYTNADFVTRDGHVVGTWDSEKGVQHE